MAYKHGAYGEITKSKAVAAAQADSVLLYVGTAPVHLIKGYQNAGLVNTPVKLRNMQEVQRYIGYADNWEKFSLCEAFYAHFNNTVKNVGPIYVTNVLNPDIHRGSQVSLSNKDFSKGYVYIETDEAIVDTVRVAGKVLDTDYTVSYDMTAGQVVIKALTTLGASETITYYPIDLSTINKDTIIGTVTDDNQTTGIQAIKQMYSKFNAVTNLLAVPGWSHIPEVYQAMVSAVQKINGHWDGFALADIPVEIPVSASAEVTDHAATLTDNKLILESLKVSNGSTVGVKDTDYTVTFVAGVLTVTLLSGGALYSATSLTLDYVQLNDTKEKAIAWQSANGYNAERSKVCFPMSIDGAGNKYHLSTMFGVGMLGVDIENNNIPFESASNKIFMSVGQYFGQYSKNPGYDQTECNDLNEKGISTCCFWNGSWLLWGPHTAAYQYGTTMDPRCIFDVNMRMLMHCTNGFQLRHGTRIDSPMSPNQKDTILNTEQAELDRLKSLGALIGNPIVQFLETENPTTDLMNGDFVFDIDVTPTPPFKSGTAKVCYTDEGFSAYFGE